MMKHSLHITMMRVLTLLVCAVAAFSAGSSIVIADAMQDIKAHQQVNECSGRGLLLPDGQDGDAALDCDKPLAAISAAETSTAVICPRPQPAVSMLNKLCLKINRNGVLQGFDSLFFESTLSGMSSVKPHYCAKCSCYAIALRHIIR